MTKNLPAPTAKHINNAHQCAKESAENAIEWAIQCGQLLAAKKEELPHGEFGDWVDSNCEFSLRMAQRYMQAAKNDTRVAFDSLRQALGYDKPKPKSDTPKGAVSVVNPEGGRTTGAKEGTEETGDDRPAAPVFDEPPRPAPKNVTPPDEGSDTDAPERPDDDELAAIEREVQESEIRVLRGDDVVAGYHDELKRQAAEIAVLKTTRDGYMRGKDAITKMLQAEQRKVAKLEKENAKLRAENEALRKRIAVVEAA